MVEATDPRTWATSAAGCAAAYLVLAWPARHTLVDDAWISARFARQAAAGNGLVYNVDDLAVEGFTNLAWTGWLTVAHLLGWPLADTMIGSGLVLGLTSLVALAALVRALSEEMHPGVLLAPLVVALDAHFAVATTNGLETALALTFWPLAIAWWLRAGDRWAPLAGLGAAAAMTVRPEGLLIVGLLCVEALIRHRSTAALRLVVPALSGAAGLSVWRWWTYGAWLPNTAAAKVASAPWTQLQRNVEVYFAPEAPYWIVASLLIPTALLISGRRPAHLAVSAIAIAMAAVALSVELWMPGGRLLLPPLVFLVAIVGSGFARSELARWGIAAALVGQCLFLASPNRERVYRYDRVHSALAGNGAERAARHLALHLPPKSWAATRDAGVFAYHLGVDVRVGELHPRALSRPHPDGARTDLGFLPKNPGVIATTVARIDADQLRYANDVTIVEATNRRYRYLGRVHQHHHRYYDIYVRADLDVPDLPPGVAVNRLGPDPFK